MDVTPSPSPTGSLPPVDVVTVGTLQSEANCTVHAIGEMEIDRRRLDEITARRERRKARKMRSIIWKVMLEKRNDEIDKKSKSEERDRATVMREAMKRGRFASSTIDEEPDENKSAGQRRNVAQLEPLVGRAMFLEQCTRARLNQLKAQCGVRDYDALYDLCVIFEGGGNVTLSASCVYHCAEFIISFCRGEVCNYAQLSHRFFRINNFNFDDVCCTEALMTLTCSTKQTFAHEELEQESDCCDCCLTRLYFCQSRMHTHTFAHYVRSRMYMCVCSCVAQVLSCNHTHIRAAQAAKQLDTKPVRMVAEQCDF